MGKTRHQERDKTVLFLACLATTAGIALNENALGRALFPDMIPLARTLNWSLSLSLALGGASVLVRHRIELVRNARIPLYAVIVFVMSLAGMEASLQAFRLVVPHTVLDLPSHVVEDEVLGHRPNPDFPGHDSRGWRNAQALETATICCLGDSQTYGTGVARRHAWPQQLERLTGWSTYNMAYGGYGPSHLLVLLDEALTLKPNLVIAAFYAGNDLIDSYAMVYERGQLEQLRSEDEGVLQALETRRLKRPPLSVETDAPGAVRAEEKKGSGQSFLARHSLLVQAVALLRARVPRLFMKDDWNRIRQKALDRGQEPFAYGTAKTVFTPRYRHAVLNQDDIQVREGLRASLEALRLMSERAAAEDIRFVVLCIPTKELVYNAVYEESSLESSDVYKQLVRHEAEMWVVAHDYLERHDIVFVDALPHLREALARGEAPYQVSDDGHPSAIGHRAIAEAIEPVVEKMLDDDTRGKRRDERVPRPDLRVRAHRDIPSYLQAPEPFAAFIGLDMPLRI